MPREVADCSLRPLPWPSDQASEHVGRAFRDIIFCTGRCGGRVCCLPGQSTAGSIQGSIPGSEAKGSKADGSAEQQVDRSQER
mmetsp:Transcript_16883/g.48212  ORF Transcript_16883/g.48212 Transcript_16883/m.48212 type:complete len:83 (-) Transcript_16883:82-330(-)